MKLLDKIIDRIVKDVADEVERRFDAKVDSTVKNAEQYLNALAGHPLAKIALQAFGS